MTKKHVKKSQKTRKKGVFLAKKVEKTCFLVFFRVFPCFQGVEKHECAHYVQNQPDLNLQDAKNGVLLTQVTY